MKQILVFLIIVGHISITKQSVLENKLTRLRSIFKELNQNKLDNEQTVYPNWNKIPIYYSLEEYNNNIERNRNDPKLDHIFDSYGQDNIKRENKKKNVGKHQTPRKNKTKNTLNNKKLSKKTLAGVRKFITPNGFFEYFKRMRALLRKHVGLYLSSLGNREIYNYTDRELSFMDQDAKSADVLVRAILERKWDINLVPNEGDDNTIYIPKWMYYHVKSYHNYFVFEK